MLITTTHYKVTGWLQDNLFVYQKFQKI